jgi:formylglycine-generating enzyme required for sulfatase activity
MADKAYFKANKKRVKKAYGSNLYKLAMKNNCDDGYAKTSPVGSFKPNNFGLYDMLGNGSEWCSDWYGDDYYSSSPRQNPQGPSSGIRHVLRGGSWMWSSGWGSVLSSNSSWGKSHYSKQFVRAANRMVSISSNPDGGTFEEGFRMVFSELVYNNF